MNKKFLTFLMALLFLLASCGGNSSDNSKNPQVSKVESFIELLKKEEYVLSAKLVKSNDETRSKTFHVIRVLSTYYYTYGDYDDESRLFDLSLYEVGDSYSEYLTKYMSKYYNNDGDAQDIRIINRDYLLNNMNSENSIVHGGTPEMGDQYVSFYDSENSVSVYYLLEETTPNSKDLEKMGAFKDEYQRSIISDHLTTEFGLSEERSEEISRTIYSWDKISNKRQMTAADANLFTKQIIGTDVSLAEDAYKSHIEGDSTNYKSLIEKAAEANGTSPEHMSELVEELLVK